MSNKTLKPCPFCGGEMIYRANFIETVTCAECGISIDAYNLNLSTDQCMELFNRRPPNSYKIAFDSIMERLKKNSEAGLKVKITPASAIWAYFGMMLHDELNKAKNAEGKTEVTS